MKKVLLILSGLMITIAFADKARSFEYNDHGKHDPFWPIVSSNGTYISYDGQATVVDIMLEGVVIDASGKNIAIINGKIVKPGEKVGLYILEAISNDHVDLIQGQERLSVKLKKGKV